MDVKSNPAAESGVANEPSTDDVESTALEMSGPITPEETVRLLVEVVDERIASNGGQSAGVDALVHHLARMDTAPTANFHQCTIYCLPAIHT